MRYPPSVLSLTYTEYLYVDLNSRKFQRWSTNEDETKFYILKYYNSGGREEADVMFNNFCQDTDRPSREYNFVDWMQTTFAMYQ